MYHILIVEDDEAMRKTLRRGLEKSEYKVTIIGDGLIARPYDLNNYDLVILDWMLPKVSGIELLTYWRKKGFKTPILMFSALENTYEKVQGLEAGADDYMGKFFEWSELKARITSLIRSKSNAYTKYYNIELFSDIIFTLIEKKIFNYLLQHVNQIKSKTSIIKAVYVDAYNPFSNVIERHINSIRTKLELHNNNLKVNLKESINNKYATITTIRGSGYRLIIE
jgi:DNA-binding response OmpR family regulator